jgi:cysteine desulfurase
MNKSVSPIYLDYAAATPMDLSVVEAMSKYFTEEFYNPSATYLPAVLVRNELNQARSVVAEILGAKTSEVIFTAGATEANNLALFGVAEQFPGCNIVVSAIEHDSVIKPAEKLNARTAPVNKQGVVDLTSLRSLIDDQTVLVSVMYANNEIGSLQPMSKIAQIIREVLRDRAERNIKLPLYLHSDAAQAANYLDLHVSRLGVDLMSLNGGKIYGPKQSGVLFIGSKVKLSPQILGGGQERNIRSGTENVAGSIGFSVALKLAQAKRHEESERLLKLQRLFIDEVKTKLPVAVLNGPLNARLPNNIHLSLPGTDNERVLLELEQFGILCAAGSACSASDEEPSHVLRALGLSDEQARSSLRFSMGRSTCEADITETIRALTAIVKS